MIYFYVLPSYSILLTYLGENIWQKVVFGLVVYKSAAEMFQW